jgi:hypothetical protein
MVAFPIGLSNGPPVRGTAPNGRSGLAEVAVAGVNVFRTGRGTWDVQQLDALIAAERATLDALAAHGLHGWTQLGNLANLPPGPSGQAQQLARVADGLQGHPALAAYEGVDEPRNPFRGPNWIRPDGLVRAYQRLKQIDPAHPVVIVQAPLGTVAQLLPYRPAFDITGADVYPVSYPPGEHTQTANRDISVVGDITKKMVQAAGGKPVWMTLQIAWSGVLPTQQHPGIVPRFPSLPAERFMAYQAIVNGARGLIFFGGHLTQIATPADAAAGWNWTFWQRVLRPVVEELSAPELAPALTARNAKLGVKASVGGIELVAREAAGFLYLIAVRRTGTASRVSFSGLPAHLTGGRVLFEYVQDPPPPPIEPGHQVFRQVAVTRGGFSDWFAVHDVHVYRFQL